MITSGWASESRCQSVYAPRSVPSAGADLRTIERRHLLTRERQRDRAAGPLEGDPPGHGRLVRVGRPHVPEVRDRSQRHVVLDRLMRRAVLAEADRVVRPDPERRQAHQCGEAHRRAHVVGEDEEGRAVRLQQRGLEREAVDDRAHRVLADAESDVAARVDGGERAAAGELGLRRFDEVGGSRRPASA